MPKITKYNGGYVIISLNDEDIYEKRERNLDKPILLTDIVINGIEKNDVFTTAYVEGTNIVFKDIYDKDITIGNDNSVTIGDNGKHLYEYILSYKDSSMIFKASILSNKNNMTGEDFEQMLYNDLCAFVINGFSISYTGSPFIYNYIYYDEGSKIIRIIGYHQNSSNELEESNEELQIDFNNNSSLEYSRQIF